MIPLPDEFPADAISKVINLKSTPRRELAEALWNLVGYGLGKLTPEQSRLMAGMSMPSDELMLKSLQGINDDHSLTTISRPIVLKWALNQLINIAHTGV